jgi:protein TonB
MAINANSYGQKDKVYKDVDVIAKYKNGSMEEFIQKNIIYPKAARDQNISAKIYVQFEVDEKGKVTNIEIARSDIMDHMGKEIVVKGYTTKANPEIDSKSVASLEAEAQRVVKSLSDFTPAQKDGKNVAMQFTIPIQFILGDKFK